MKIAPPNDTQIDAAVARARHSVARTVRRRQTLTRTGIGIGAVALLGIAGTGAATAFFPQYYDLQGVVKTAYAESFVDCIQTAGWDAQIVTGAEGDSIVESWGLDTATHTAVSSHLAKESQGAAGRAISLCQEQLSKRAGESIMGVSG